MLFKAFISNSLKEDNIWKRQKITFELFKKSDNDSTYYFKMNIKYVRTVKQDTFRCTYKEQAGISYIRVKTS